MSKGLQISESVHQKLVDAAKKRQKKINQWASELLSWAVDQVNAGNVPDAVEK